MADAQTLEPPPAGGPVASAPTRPNRPGASPKRAWALPAAAGLLAAVALPLLGPPIVNGDTMFHLVWGRELLHGELDGFETGPTPHPLLLVAGALTALLGDDGSRVVTYALFGPVALGALVAATAVAGRAAASAWAGVVAVVILLTSLPVLSNAMSARYDVAFGALVVTAIALEATRLRRGAPVLVVLAIAGLIRPEAWLLAGVYWLWLAPSLTWRSRVGLAALVAAAPVFWVIMDALVTGDPLYSLHVTDAGSDAFYRQYTPWENLAAAWRNFLSYVGVVPIVALPLAVVLLVRDGSRAARPLLLTLALTVGIFLAFLSQGLASSERYLFVPACVLALLAGVAAAGGARVSRSRVMTAVFVSVFVLAQGFARADVYGKLTGEANVVAARADSSEALVGLPGVREALRRCEQVALPTHNLIPLFALYSGRSPDRFRSDGRGRTQPDLYIAPASAKVAEEVLTRPRFDDDPTFVVPTSLEPGPRNEHWVVHVSRTSTCASALLE